VIGTISAIAGQTNLLALNATIEAAAVEQQNITTRGIAESIHIAAGHTARASVAINSAPRTSPTPPWRQRKLSAGKMAVEGQFGGSLQKQALREIADLGLPSSSPH
jgi:hypothetical protein